MVSRQLTVILLAGVLRLSGQTFSNDKSVNVSNFVPYILNTVVVVPPTTGPCASTTFGGDGSQTSTPVNVTALCGSKGVQEFIYVGQYETNLYTPRDSTGSSIACFNAGRSDPTEESISQLCAASNITTAANLTVTYPADPGNFEGVVVLWFNSVSTLGTIYTLSFNSLMTYGMGDVVFDTGDSNWYQSKISGNVGNVPHLNPSLWQLNGNSLYGPGTISGNTLSSGTLATWTINNLVLAGLACNVSGTDCSTISVVPPWTMGAFTPYNSGVSVGAGLAYYFAPSVGSVSATLSINPGSGALSANISSF